MISAQDIERLAQLSRISLDKEEKEQLRQEIESILGYVSEIQSVASGELKPKAGLVRNVFRDDKDPHAGGEYSESLLSEAPGREGDYIKVKKIL
jgi:aspartyl-tRNA(Asn)/glutamyl-tRNA(Gln) amidotransferase subunit C